MQNAKVQRMMKKDKEIIIEEQCQRIEEITITNSTINLYQGIRKLTKKIKPMMDAVKSEDGIALCDGDYFRERWKEYYYSKLYKKNTIIDAAPLDWQETDNEPPLILEEVKEAINALTNWKSSGADEITAELIKSGEYAEIYIHKLLLKTKCGRLIRPPLVYVPIII